MPNPFHLWLKLAFLALLVAMLARPQFAHADSSFPDIPVGGFVPSPQPLNAYSSDIVIYRTGADGIARPFIGSPPAITPYTVYPTATVTPPATATVANPLGFVPKNVGGVAVLESSAPIRVLTPIGSPVSAATKAAADAVKGALLDAGSLVKTIPLGVGAGSVGVKIGAAALGVGSAVAGALGSPVLMGGLLLASVGMSGYEFYQQLKNTPVPANPPAGGAAGSSADTGRITLNPDGSGAGLYQEFLPDTKLNRCIVWAKGQVLTDPMVSYMHLQNVSALVTVGDDICYMTSNGTFDYSMNTSPRYYYVRIPAYTLTTPVPPSASRPLTNDQLMSAIIGAMGNLAASLDAAKYAIEKGVPLPSLTDSTGGYSALDTASSWVQESTSTDSLGNITEVVSRNRLTAPLVGSGATPQVLAQKETVTIINAAPSSSTSTPIIPSITDITSVSNPSKLSDLCVQNPNILACADIHNLGDVPAVTVPNVDKVIGSLTPVPVGSVGVCPAPITLNMPFGKTVVIDIWHYPCEFAGAIKVFNLISASFASMYILMGAFRNV